MARLFWFVIFALTLGHRGAHAWDQDQLDVFDVVEEVNQNFYELMNIKPDADGPQIKKAFRNLSLVLHPDKNDSPDADVQFRNLVSVYEVLRDPNKRRHYDDVLVNGLPNWRSAVYYYRHYRKMGLAEMIVILFVLVTIGQYLIGWASYLEKKYTHEQVYQAKIEKKKKKLAKKGENVDDLVETFDFPKPSITNTLPFQIPRLVWSIIVGFPVMIRQVKQAKKEAERRKLFEEEERKRQAAEEAEAEARKAREKAGRKRRQAAFKPEERDDSELPPPPVRADSEDDEVKPTVVRVTGGLWTDDDINDLVQLIRKYPGGTPDRWERIADLMCRSVPEVTFMAGKLKDRLISPPTETQDADEPFVTKKQKTRGGKAVSPDVVDEWTQTQQKALEAALAKHPKGPADRWERIARCVPGKTKEECMVRYRQLAEMVRKKKEQTAAAETEEKVESNTETEQLTD